MLNHILTNMELFICSFKCASKTDVKQAWLNKPKSGPPQETQTIDDMFPGPQPLSTYR